jgi:hypothetical protein
VTAFAGAGVNEVITLDSGRVGIRQDGKGETVLLDEIAGDVRWINTDGNWTNSDCVDFG